MDLAERKAYFSTFMTFLQHDAIEYALFKGSVLYRKTDARDYYLSQAADLICWVELTALKCTESGMSPTGNRFFGSIGPFKRNYLKKIRAKRL